MGHATPESNLAPSAAPNLNAPAEPVPVAEIHRVSTLAQAGPDRAGIPAQHASCVSQARTHNAEIIATLTMTNVSGAAVMFCPEMKRLLQLVKSGRCKGVVMKEFSRIMRPENFEDYALFQVFKENGVKLYTEAGVFDLSKGADQFMATVHSGMAGYERTQIKDRMNGGKEAMRVRGECPTSALCLPLGVRYSKKTGWAYDPLTIGKVQHLFELFTQGETNFCTLAQLTGIHARSISNILRNELYIGWRVYAFRRDPKTSKVRADGSLGDAKKVRRDQPLRVKVFEQGAVNDATFAKAQLMLEAKRDGGGYHKHQKGDDPFLFRGMLRCGICGGHVTTIRKARAQGMTEYYVCQAAKGWTKWDPATNTRREKVKPASCQARRLERVKLEKQLDEFIQAELTRPGFINSLLQAQQQAGANTSQQAALTRLKRDLEVCQQRMRKLQDVYLGRSDGEMSKAEYDQRRAELKAQETQVRYDMAKVKPTVPKVGNEELLAMVRPFVQWDRQKPADKRRILVQTIPLFNVSAVVPEGLSRMAAPKEYEVNGFWINLPGLEDQQQGAQNMPQTRINTDPNRVANISNHLQMVSVISHPIYLQLK